MMQSFYGSTACYLFKDDKILFIKFSEKWGQIYASPVGKIDDNETPTECIIREFKEEKGIFSRA
ncbi:NUDIX domain-containing protein [Paenibacillus sp. HW567]|uniref:NUDIX domain-containing protein n=1 Tax=Paenibacillus sp. HW567 TaxID=1034769 RepID=UPI00036DE4FF|nr:NUDIX domain-containing protein [Paenibacillus sp. HW567]